MSDQEPNSINCKSVLVGLSSHLDCLAQRICQVEETLGGLFTGSEHLDGRITISKLQALDFVRQALEDCALLVHYLALEQGSDNIQTLRNSQKLLAELKLEATQSLLTPTVAPAKKQPPVHDGGIDLF